ncbi:hypothetical protein L1887_18097 [Cichorium endivia]|nr:hypothetical protein L1887_18097 [Cichorium endivia]
MLSKPMSVWAPLNFPSSLVELCLYGENSGVVSFAVAEDVNKTTTPSSSFLLPPSLVSLELCAAVEKVATVFLRRTLQDIKSQSWHKKQRTQSPGIFD